jgi:aminoglycoside 3-N-acetyltransferase
MINFLNEFLQKKSVILHTAFSKISRHYDISGEEFLRQMIAAGASNLVFPTLSWRLINSSRTSFFVFERQVDTGYINNLAAEMFPELRSVHPTHSVVCVGINSGEIILGHEKSVSQCGIGSPWEKLANLEESYSVFLNCDLRCATIFHHYEEVLFPETYLAPHSHSIDLIGKDGERYEFSIRPHSRAQRSFPKILSYVQEHVITHYDKYENTLIILPNHRVLPVLKEILQIDPEFLLAKQ